MGAVRIANSAARREAVSQASPGGRIRVPAANEARNEPPDVADPTVVLTAALLTRPMAVSTISGAVPARQPMAQVDPEVLEVPAD